MSDEIWYRVSHVVYEQTGVQPCVDKMPVVRHTEKCVVLNYRDQEKRVLKVAFDRFAYPTLEEAFQSFRRRKKSQIRILRSYLANAELGLEITLQDVERATIINGMVQLHE